MLKSITRSVRNKLMLVVLATTVAALLVTALAMVIYELRTYQQAWVSDLVTQADILARASAPALAFDDPRAAGQESLALLKVRPKILSAAIYTPAGALFASYAQPSLAGSVPTRPSPEGFRIDGDRLEVYHRIIENKEMLGTVYLSAQYELLDRLKGYLGILGGVLVASLLVALLISSWLQAAVTKPILDITQVAHRVMDRRDFTLRVDKTTDDEIGYLVDAFNAMLAEVGRRAEALEASNQELQHEMQVRRSAELALLAADRRKDEFLATLAHELRNPLAPLRNALQILRVAGNNETAARTAREVMERQLVQMVRLVDDLLDVSRITTGKLALKIEAVELATVVRNAVDTVAPFVEARGHTRFELDLPDQPVWLWADPTRLSQVLSNLVNNAAKYTDPGGRITFAARRESAAPADIAAGITSGDVVVVSVSDTGIGIEAGMLRDVFEMFTQADYSLERSQAGLGVGLTLARRLVELHGGTITAESPGLGQGSVFTVRLPVMDTAAVAAAAETTVQAL